MIVQNIENKIKLSLFVSAGSFITSLLLVGMVMIFSYKQIAMDRERIYVLSNGVPFEATQMNVSENRPAEYKAHVQLFHNLFFSLTPDNKYIEEQMKKAMYLVDESGVAQYNNLKEAGFFNSILSSSSVITLKTDSIQLDVKARRFVFFGKQRIERQSTVVIRSLITEGYLKDIDTRTENNGHAVLITGWKTIENKELQNVQKNNF